MRQSQHLLIIAIKSKREDETMFEVYVMKGTIAHGVLRTGSKEEAKKLTEKLLKKGEDAFWERIA